MTADLYHYTSYAYLPKIRKDHAIKPDTKSTFRFLWLSTADPWEPKAGKRIDIGRGKHRRLMFQEQRDKIGCARFILTDTGRKFLDWESIKRYPGFSVIVRQYESEAVRIGSNPHNWYVTLEAISLDEMCFEVWEDERWRPGNIDSIADQINQMLPKSWQA